MIFENKFADFTAEEIVALLSCFVCQEKTKKKHDNEAIDRNSKNFKGGHNITHEKVVYVKRDNDEEDQGVDGDKDIDESDEDDDESDDDDEPMTPKLQEVFMYTSNSELAYRYEWLFMVQACQLGKEGYKTYCEVYRQSAKGFGFRAAALEDSHYGTTCEKP